MADLFRNPLNIPLQYMDFMDDDLRLLYGIKERFSEMTYRRRDNQDLKNVYSFSGGISEGIPSGKEGSISLDGEGETVDYTLDRVRGKPLLRMSHSFEEIEEILSDDGF